VPRRQMNRITGFLAEIVIRVFVTAARFDLSKPAEKMPVFPSLPVRLGL